MEIKLSQSFLKINNMAFRINRLSSEVEDNWQHIYVEGLEGIRSLKLIELRKDYWDLKAYSLEDAGAYE